MDPTIIATSVLSLLDIILKLRESARQSGEWTAEQEEEFTKKLATAFASPHWQPSSPQSQP